MDPLSDGYDLELASLACQSSRLSWYFPEQAIADQGHAQDDEKDGKPPSPSGSGIDFGFGGVARVVNYRDLLSRLGNEATATVADSRHGLDIPAIESPEGQDRMPGSAAPRSGRLLSQADHDPSDTLAYPVQAAVQMNAIASGYGETQANDERKHGVTIRLMSLAEINDSHESAGERLRASKEPVPHGVARLAHLARIWRGSRGVGDETGRPQQDSNLRPTA